MAVATMLVPPLVAGPCGLERDVESKRQAQNTGLVKLCEGSHDSKGAGARKPAALMHQVVEESEEARRRVREERRVHLTVSAHDPCGGKLLRPRRSNGIEDGVPARDVRRRDLRGGTQGVLFGEREILQLSEEGKVSFTVLDNPRRTRQAARRIDFALMSQMVLEGERVEFPRLPACPP